MSKILSTQNISKSYKNSAFPVISSLSLDIEKGSIVCITGESGAGKSTLLHILGAIDKPDSGKVILYDNSLPYGDDNKISQIRNSKFGFVFQFHYLLSEFTVLENIIIPSLINGSSIDKALDKALLLLRNINLQEKANRFPLELSGGERQRVSLLRAIINSPDIVFADEPTGNLDMKNRDIIYGLMSELSQEGVTLIIVTHSELPYKNSLNVVMERGKPHKIV